MRKIIRDVLLFLFGLGVSVALVQARIQQASAASVHPAARPQFRYVGLGREAFHPAMAQWLLRGGYAPFAQAATAEFPIPGLAAGYVPQGICYSEALDCFLLAAYYPEGERPSLLSLVDAATGALIKNLYLLHPDGSVYNGHASAVASADRHAWIAVGGWVFHLLAEDLRAAGTEGTVRFRDVFNTGRRGGFAFCAEGMLWLGEYTTPEGGQGRCAGYPLNGGAPMGFDPSPVFAFSVPDHVQGACGTKDGLYFSVSHGIRNPSRLLIYPPLREIMHKSDRMEGSTSLPFHALDETRARCQALAPMSEGVAAHGGKVYVLFESAALPYRRRVELFADYVYSVPEKAR